MFKKAFLTILVMVLIGSLSGQIPYNNKKLYLPGSPGTIDNGMMGVMNPANAFYNRSEEIRYYWADMNQLSNISYFGYVTGLNRISFSFFQEKMDNRRVYDYTLSLAQGNEMFSVGTVYGWSSGNRAALKRKTYAGTGFIFRPFSRMSLGGLVQYIMNGETQYYAFDAGYRPLGNKKLTLFAETDFSGKQKIRNYQWRYGGKFELFNGLGMITSVDDRHFFNIGFNFSLGVMAYAAFTRYNDADNKVGSMHMLRLGGMEKSALYEKLVSRQMIKMELKGNAAYRGYRLFNPRGKRFYEIISDIEKAGKSSQVLVLAVNLSGLTVGAEKAWEIRQAFTDFRKMGKRLVVYIDQADMTLYHLASAADLVVLDPEGQLFLKGYAMTRTYFKGTLEKLGLAFDEWRFFKYKSAAEALSRESMSEADREQRQKFLDDLYVTVRTEVIKNRKISAADFDRIIDEQVILLPEDAKEKGLVDWLGRWSRIDEIIDAYMGERPLHMPGLVLNQYMNVDERWGEEPRVAVVYALGECAMDSGIKARELEEQLLALGESHFVKAIVLRVDSPGGDALASDLVAEAVQTCRKSKPVIISQGAVAASGGYWISMYGDSILASPMTVTASIGVIGGWIYDRGLTGKMGLSSDMVKVGKHADLGTGASIPFIGQIPARNLTADERTKMSTAIMTMYRRFVQKVADGRGLAYDQVEPHAQGRIYSGMDGYQYQLVDRLGGLQDAVDMAIKLAGLQDQPVEVVEYGKYLGFFPLPFSERFPVSQQLQFSDPATRYYLTYPLNHPYRPMLMVNPEGVKVR